MINSVSGIYKIQSTIKPEKFYIGSSKNIHVRWGVHKGCLKYNKHHSPILQYHVNKYGLDDLTIEVIEECDESILIKREQYYIDTLNPYLNATKIAGKPNPLMFTPEIRKKISDGLKGRVRSKEHCLALSIANKGKPCSEEKKQKMREQLIRYRESLPKKEKKIKEIKIRKEPKRRKRTPEELKNNLIIRKINQSITRRRIVENGIGVKPIAKLDNNLNIIKTYKSLTEASKEINRTCGALVRACKNQEYKCGKFKWKYIHG